MDIKLNLESFNKTYLIGDSITGNITIKNKRYESKYDLSLILIGRYHISNKRAQPPVKINEKFITKEYKIIINGDIQKGISPFEKKYRIKQFLNKKSFKPNFKKNKILYDIKPKTYTNFHIEKLHHK